MIHVPLNVENFSGPLPTHGLVMVCQLDRSLKVSTALTGEPRKLSHARTCVIEPAETPLMPPGTEPPPPPAGTI